MVLKKWKRMPLSAPARLFFHLTNRCNFRCKYCFVDANIIKPQDEISVYEIKDIFDQCEALNVLVIRLFGGEPLARPDIAQIIRLSKQYSFSTRINTNGYFINSELAKIIKDAGVGWVNVSLDGPEKIHEELCGVPNSFKKVMAGIELLKSNDIRVGLEFVLNSANIGHLEETLKIAAELDVERFRILPLAIVGRAHDLASSLAVPYSIWKDFYFELTIRKIEKTLPFNDISIDAFDCNFCSWQLYYPLPIEKRKELLKKAWGIDLDRATSVPGGLRCTAAINCCAIIANGDVYPCDQMMGISSLRAGNIRKNNLKDIWLESKVFSMLRNITRQDLIGHCRTCENKFCTGYNRGAAYHATGSILGSDSNCIRAAN